MLLTTCGRNNKYKILGILKKSDSWGQTGSNGFAVSIRTLEKQRAR
jgi:hypothetical protein